MRVPGLVCLAPYRYYTLYCVLFKTLGEIPFSPKLKHFFNNTGTVRLLVSVVTAIKSMAAVELHSLWLESPPKPANMGIWLYNAAFAKAPQISSPSATTTRTLLFETQSFRRLTSYRSGSRPLSTWPTCCFSAACSACSSWSTDSLLLSGDSLLREPSIKEQISLRCCKWRCGPLHTADKHGDCVSCLGTAHTKTVLSGTECHHCSDIFSALAAGFLFREKPRPSRPPAFFSQGRCYSEKNKTQTYLKREHFSSSHYHEPQAAWSPYQFSAAPLTSCAPKF